MIDFVSMNKDFQRFVSIVSETISQKCPEEGEVSISNLMLQNIDDSIMNKLPSLTTTSMTSTNLSSSKTLHEALGDIISSIRENIGNIIYIYIIRI